MRGQQKDMSWLDSDSNDCGYQLLSDEDVFSNITTPSQDEQSSEEEDNDIHETPTYGAVAVKQVLGLVCMNNKKESTAHSLLMVER